MQPLDQDDKIIVIEERPDDPEAERDFLRCMQYISLFETGPKNIKMKDVADSMGVSVTTLYNWRNRWLSTGILQTCRARYFLPSTVQDIREKYGEVLRDWGKVIDRQLRTAIHSNSDQFSLLAAQWLEEKIVSPAINSVEQPSTQELEFVENVLKSGLNDVFDI